MDDGEDCCDFERTVAVKEMDTPGIRDALREVQRVGEAGSMSLSSTIVKVVDLALVGIEMKR